MSTYRRLLQILSVIVILSMMFSSFSVPIASAQSGDGIKREHNAQTGKVSFIGPESGRALPAAKALGISASARLADPALALAKRFGPEFGLKNPARDLKEKKSNHSNNSRLAVHYQQSYQGIPVMGGELIVNTNERGDLYSINGEISPDLSLSTQPAVDSEKARQTALDGAAKWYQKSPEDFVVSEPELWIYDESLLQPSTRPVELVWRMEVMPKDTGRPVRELVLVNAQRGNISLHFNQVDTAWTLSGKTDTAQDVQPTSTPQPTETPLPTEEAPVEQPETGSTATPTPTPTQSDGEGSASSSRREVESLTDGTWYVSTTGNDSNSCLEPALPCVTIQAAINKASSGNTIKVAEGTYYYTSINANPNVVIINKSITLSGGWQSDFSSQTGASIIDGENINNGILANAAGSTVVVEHFVIQHSRTGSDSGGIYLYAANLTLRNSSVINNNSGRGAGIFMINNPSLTLLNSTLSGNRAGSSGGGIHAVSGTIIINNSTIAYNNSNGTGGGMVVASGNATLRNSILAKNTATTSGPNCSGSIGSSDHNIIENTAGCTVTNGTGDQFNVDPLIDSALTGTLPLHTLQATSPAVDAGDNSTCLLIDQRGMIRPQGSACDIGAYELVTPKSISILSGSNQTTRVSTVFTAPLSVFVIDEFGNPASGVAITFTAPASGASITFADTGTNVTTAITGSNGVATSTVLTANNQPGGYSVSATAEGYDFPAIFDLSNTSISIANLYVSPSGSDSSSSCNSPTAPCLTIGTAIYWAAPGDTIAVANGIYTGSSGASVVGINKDVTLSGGWNNTFNVQDGISIIDGQGARRAVVNSATGASIENFTIRGGYDATQGGGIYNSGTLTITNSDVSGNASGWMGAGIYNYGTLTINNTSITNNRGPSSGSGGGGGSGIQNYSGTVVMNNSTVSGNVISPNFSASGIVNYGSFTLNNSTVSENTGADAIYNIGTLMVNNSTVSHNAKYGIRHASGTVTLGNSILANNYTTASGQDCTGIITSSGYNLISNTTGCTFAPSTGDQTNVNPMISAYPIGFPSYHTLLSDSPAIDAGNPETCLERDQRGLARPQGPTCDIGAYEYTGIPGTAASFGIVSGNNQRAGVSLPFSLPLLVYVVDASGSPVKDASVTFTAPASGPSGTFADTGTNTTTVSTNNEGMAIPSTFTANSQWGTYNLTATVSGLSGSVAFILTNGAWFVSPTGNDANSCSSAAAPCLTISNAMIKAANVDVINVAVGTYSPIAVTKSLIISGGWDSTFGSQIGYSTISGSPTTNGITASAQNISVSRFIVRNSDFGIYHSSGTLNFVQGALIGNHNGIYNLIGDTTFTNTTLSGNHPGSYAGAAISNVKGTIRVQYSTITSNAGSYAISSTNSDAFIEIGNSILAGNDDADCNMGSANLTSVGHNIFGHSPVCSGTSNFAPQSTDQVGVDPKLSTVLLPGGYHAISASSPAVDHADPVSCPTTDQRGVARSQGSTCDVGAYEYKVPGSAFAFGISSGSDQRTTPSTPFLLPLIVYVTDAFGSPVSGVNITFTAPTSGPSGAFVDTGTNTTTAVTQEGIAASSIFTANSQLGNYNVTATASGLPNSVAFALTNTAWFVSPTGSDENSCNLPTTPCLTINGAIGKATAGDAIKVATGTYTTSSSAVANITKDLSLSGGWDSTFSEQTGFSILDGSNRAYYGISTGASNVSISRFVIQNSSYGIYHSGGNLSFERGALINSRNGIYNYDGNTTFINTTISGNIGGGTAGSAISNVRGVVTVRSSTITNNSGSYAISSGNGYAFIKIGNSILAGNSQDCNIGSNPSISEGYNIFGSQPACSGSVTLQPTDKVGTNPKLLPLFPLGYHPILPSSPAVDAANPAVCPDTDQRGATRPAGEGCDIGAYEYTAPGPAASFGIASGSNQRVGPAMPFLLPLTVYVIDEAGSSVSGASVTFTAPTSGPSGTFADTGTNTTTVITQSGLAASPVFTANAELGSYNVTATVDGLPGSVSFALTNAAWYVAPTGSDSNSCNLPTAPCLTINGAIGKASAGDAIKVAVGTYTGSSSPVVNITKDLNLSGGWNSSFSEQIGFSTIDGTNKTYNGISSNSLSVSISRFIVQNSGYGIYHYKGMLNFERGALINNKSGIYNYDGDTTFTNATISGNVTTTVNGSAIINQAGIVTIRYSTITNNSGGTSAVYSTGSGASIKIGNSILAGNSQDCYIGSNPSISEGYNIFGSQPACSGSVVLQSTDKVGTDPKLLPLFPAGYHPILMGSPAVDAANPAVCPAADQRGVSRPVGAGCDIGAFEYQATGTIPAYIIAYEGSQQSIVVGKPAATRLKAAVLDETGNGVPGQTVTFTGPVSGAGIVFADTGTYISTVATDANGIATSPAFSANNITGSYTVAAIVTGLAGSADFALFNDLYSYKVKTYTASNGTSLPGTFLCDQSLSSCTNNADPHADAAHKYAMGTYSLYMTQYQRDSIDNHNMTIISSVHYASGYANAGWTGSQMVYGDPYGFPLGDDVVAHELTHGVTQYESNLFYYYQSGAINESFSDLWGEYYDQANGQGNDSESVEWLMGEDVSGLGAIRSMSNPPAYGDPDMMSSPNYYTGAIDNGGVHTNSGVNNKAVFLMVEGGSFNGKTISALGWEKTAAIYYEANTNLLSSGADYSDLYYALQQACTNLIGQKGITSSDCAEVKNASDAVEMNGQPVADFNPEAPYCAEGYSPAILFSDGLESGTGNWTFSNGSSTRWQLDSQYGQYAHTGDHFLYADDYPATTTDASAQLTPVTLPSDAFLHFAHAYDFQSSGSYYYDGGVLEYSIDGGSTWNDAGSLIDFNGYDGTIRTGNNNPLQGRSAFGGSSHGYISTRLNLAPLAGQTVAFRWRMGLDQSSYVWGWWVDDVKVYQCAPDDTTPPAVTSIVRANADPTSAASVDFTATFSEPVTGVDGNDFALDLTDNVSGAEVVNVTGSGSIWTVTVNTGSGDGTLGLRVPVSAEIADLAGNPLTGLPFTGEHYTVDKTVPVIFSIGRVSTVWTNAASVDFRATFSEPVTGMDAGDFSLHVETGNITGAVIENVTADAGCTTYCKTYIVSVNTGSGDGVLASIPASNATATDAAGNQLGNPPYLYMEAYLIDKTAPVVSSVVRASTDPTSADSVDFTLTFSEEVNGVDMVAPFNDFILHTTGVTGAVITDISGSGATWTVTVNTGSGDGTLGLDLAADAGITDPAGNLLDQAPFTPDEEYTIGKTYAFLIAPVNSEPLLHRRPTFDWSDVPGVSVYRIAFSQSSTFSTVLGEVDTTDSTYTATADLSGGQVYYWRVRAQVNNVWGPWSAAWSFTTGNPPSVPALSSPANASLTTDYTPLLNWNNSTVPSGTAAFDHYQVQVATDALFASPMLIDESTAAGQIAASSYTPTTDLAANTTYFWRVRSFNVSGQYSSWSTVRSFRTAFLPPGNLTPSGGVTVSSRMPVLDWDAVAGAGGYTIQISTSSSFSSLLVNTSTTTDTFTPGSNLPARRTIYWRVRATGTNGPSSWTTASFRTP